MVKNVDIPQEYIRTELGIIPNDWKIKEFQDVMTGFFSGATPYRGRTEYYKGNIKWITSGELNYNIITDTVEKITEEAVRNTNLKILPKGTFLFAITGLEAEGTRGSCGITGVEATTNQSCMALFPKETLDYDYLYHFYVWQGKMLAFRYCQGTKQQSYTGKIARTLPIILPPTILEQTAIATVLSDTDTLIENLEKLIVKKRNIKQGAMQELLTGRKRLVGFDGKWEEKRLGEILKLQGGYAFKSEQFQGNGISIVRISNIDNNTVDLSEVVYYPEFNIPVEFIIKQDDVLIAMSGATTGKIGIYKLPFYSYQNQRVGKFVLINAKTNNLNYVSHLVNSEKFKSSLQKEIAQGAQPNISGKQIESIVLDIPTDIKEQTAIANILSSMESEIEVLEDKTYKYRMIKQGMMQVLLTGKIRLS